MTERLAGWLRALAAAALALALALALASWPPARRLLDGLEARVGDQLLQMLPAQAGSFDDGIVIVDIDARAVGKRGRFHSWTRRELAARWTPLPARRRASWPWTCCWTPPWMLRATAPWRDPCAVPRGW